MAKKRRTRRRRRRRRQRRRRRRKGGVGLWRRSSRVRPGTAAQANPPPPLPPMHPAALALLADEWENDLDARAELQQEQPVRAALVEREVERRARRRRLGVLARLIPRWRRRPAPPPRDEEALRDAAMQQPRPEPLPPQGGGGRKKRGRRRSTRQKQRKRRKRRTKRQRGGEKQRWLLLGITHEEMRQRNYKDPTNGGTIVTFDDGTGVPEGIDIKGNIYDINKWRDILDTYGPNSFDVIFVDGGLNAGRKFGFKFAEVRAMSDAVFVGIDEIVARLLKPTGKFMRVGGRENPPPPTIYMYGAQNNYFKSPPEYISDPFGRGVDGSNVWEIDRAQKIMAAAPNMFSLEEVEEALAIKNNNVENAVTYLLLKQ